MFVQAVFARRGESMTVASGKIRLGFEIRSGEEVEISPSHLIVTGVTQLSGKTTTLEALIKRSKSKAIVFKTKVGETGFTEGTIIPPYFKEKSDWQYVSALLEATLKERLKFERSWIIRVCKNTSTLAEVKANIDEILAREKLRQLDRSIFTTLQAYLELVLPQLQYANFSRTLVLQDGINIMDLERFSGEIQSLVIRSVLETVLNEMKNAIVVVPEAWKFLPQGRGNPCKQMAEEFIRQGATNGNFLWIDSQDMTGVDKTPLKQVSTWILGLQTEKNEVIRTLDQMPLPKKQKPTPDEIMTLNVGHFYLCSPRVTKKVYVQPSWLDEETAKNVALGKIKVDKLTKPNRIAPFAIAQPEAMKKAPIPEAQKYYVKIQQDIAELRLDFFAKIQEQQQRTEALAGQLLELRSTNRENSVDEIVSRVLQKLPTPTTINKQEIINEALARVPRVSGMVTYEVAPLEKIQKDFLEETKQKILSDVSSLDDEQKKILKFVETQNKGCNQTHILSRCLFVSATSGGTRSRVSQKCRDVASLGLIRMDKNAVVYPYLKNRIEELLGTHNASEQEREQVYNHILMEIL